ncbi:MAG: polysaccharide deacetylase family protein [Mycobacterium leprae]
MIRLPKFASLISVMLVLLAVILQAGAASHLHPAQAAPVLAQGGSVAAQAPLKRGDRGEAVRELQNLLKQAGCDPGKVDGIFGPLTENGVKCAQQAFALKVDGVAEPALLTALRTPPAPKVAATTPAAPAAQTGAGATRQVADLVFYPAAGVESATAPGQAQQQSPDLIALTFNGDPDPELLPQILAALKKYGMQATFFIRGAAAEQAPSWVASIAAAGHAVENNGYAALDMTGISQAAMGAQIQRASTAIAKATGRKPAYFRPPSGRFSGQLSRAAAEQGMGLVLWTNVAVTDRAESDPAELADQFAAAAYPGAILMLHQDRPNTVKSLESLLHNLRDHGYQSVTMSRLMTP